MASQIPANPANPANQVPQPAHSQQAPQPVPRQQHQPQPRQYRVEYPPIYQPVYEGVPYNPAPVGAVVVPELVIIPAAAESRYLGVCPHCGSHSPATTVHIAGPVTFIWTFLICITFFPLVCIPLCVDSCKDRQLICPNCHQVRAIIPARFC